MAPTTAAPKKLLDISVTKPTPYTFDLGLLLATDPNPLPPASSSSSSSSSSTPAATDSQPASLEDRLTQNARDGAQALINQLLSTLPLQSTSDGVLLSLPAATTSLPREKPLPPAKQQTKWQAFAAKKGIKPKTREQRHAKSSRYNEATGEWEKTWGFDRKKREAAAKDGRVQNDWLVEVDGKTGKGKGKGSEGRSVKRRRKA